MRPQPLLVQALAALAAAGCGSITLSTSSPSPSTDPAKAPPAATSTAQADAGEAAKGRTACGSSTCAAGSEVCCAVEGSAARCAPAPAGLPKANDAAFPKVFSTCIPSPKPGEGYSGAFSLCDDSADCAAGEICCEAAFDAEMGPALRRCTADRGTCAAAELCREGTCATAGTTCSDAEAGQCRPTGVKMACGALTCSGETPVCYAGPKTDGNKGWETHCSKVGKRPHSETAMLFAYECASNGDCPPGTQCGGSGNGEMGTMCVGWVDYGSSAVACRTQADCKDVKLPWDANAKMTCTKAEGPSKLSFCMPPG